MEDIIKATIEHKRFSTNVEKARKEKHFYKSCIVIDCKTKTELVNLRFYGTQAMNYACIWAHNKDWTISLSGGGKAGGYGYHRESAAALNAINAAGITLSRDIGGRGHSATCEAVMSIARMIAPKGDLMLVEAYA